LLVTTSVVVGITAIKPTVADVLTELNALLGLVRAALVGNPTLGGYAQRIRYVSCDQPEVVDLTASPCEAGLEINFEIERFEQHATPYA
jgi:hypothetical protein